MNLTELIRNIFDQNSHIQSENIVYDVVNDLLRGSNQSFHIFYGNINSEIIAINQSEYSITWKFTTDADSILITIYGTTNTPAPHFTNYKII